uniref:Uncharacterized protein n=1 Tax=Glossina pallidipes TaxID=7398 RepID=A0A1B0AJ30_GLOPL
MQITSQTCSLGSFQCSAVSLSPVSPISTFSTISSTISNILLLIVLLLTIINAVSALSTTSQRQLYKVAVLRETRNVNIIKCFGRKRKNDEFNLLDLDVENDMTASQMPSDVN